MHIDLTSIRYARVLVPAATSIGGKAPALLPWLLVTEEADGHAVRMISHEEPDLWVKFHGPLSLQSALDCAALSAAAWEAGR